LDEVLDPNVPLGDLIDDPSVPLTLRRWIAARDVTCTFPGCRRRPRRCDIVHVESWQQGGRTDAANLEPLFRRHRRSWFMPGRPTPHRTPAPRPSDG
jgi:hypothetical protein